MRYIIVLKTNNTYHIVMAVTNDLATDRRVARHAAALTEAGYHVTLVGRELPESPAVEHPYPTIRMKLRHRRGWRFYAEYNCQLAALLRGMNIDAVWANDLDTLPACWLTARRKHCRLVLDCHELFPEVPEIQNKPVVKWVWRMVEQLIPQCDALLTVCDSIANHYHQKFGVEMTVVRNLPESGHCTNTVASHSSPYTLLYQGAVNLGRGVDWAIDALEFLPDCRLVVAGDGDLLEQMKDYAASKEWSDRINFLGRVMPEELVSLTRQADVGLVMLENMGLNYYYALPNRIGDFVAAGVPMVVSDLPEMARVVRKYNVGEVIDRLHGADGKAQARALAEAVKRLLERWSTLDDAEREARFATAREDLNWDKEKLKLMNLCYTTFC